MRGSEIPHLLVAEDELAIRTLLARQLQKAGYRVTTCEDGREAIDLLEAARPDLILADWMMPRLDGLGLCRAAREKTKSGALDFTYFILLTAQSEKKQIVQGLEAGADDYLTKPYDTAELLARVRAGLRLRELQRQLAARNLELTRANEEVLALNRRLEALANTDGLTELCNRRYFLERFDQAWNQARRENRTLGCIMLDVDRFKSVNDTHGHAAGDLVLKAVAQICRRIVRSYDLVARLGGEEFCALLFPTDATGMPSLAERMRAEIEAAAVPTDSAVLQVSASFGVALMNESHHAPAELIAAADALLYLAKKNGRNQIWMDSNGVSIRYEPDGALAV